MLEMRNTKLCGVARDLTANLEALFGVALCCDPADARRLKIVGEPPQREAALAFIRHVLAPPPGSSY